MSILKLQLLKVKHSQIWLRKELRKMIIKMTAFETLENVN
jgi:hypothetical protein